MLLGAERLSLTLFFYQFQPHFRLYRITCNFFAHSKLQNLILNIKSTNLTPIFIILQHLYHLVPSISRKILFLRQIVASNLKQRFLPYL
jgi:hypothetical protein